MERSSVALAMGWLLASLYDRSMRATEEACLAAWRRELLGDLTGSVLEIGAGTGINLAYYPRSIDRLRLCEPDPHMRRRLERRADEEPDFEVIDAAAATLPVASGELDAVVSTLVLCSVRDPHAALAEIFRVLRPGGRLVFLEHVASQDAGRLRWQGRLEPLWKRLAGNCHLTRRTAELIERAGLSLEEMQSEDMRKAFPFVRPTIRGTAIKA